MKAKIDELGMTGQGVAAFMKIMLMDSQCNLDELARDMIGAGIALAVNAGIQKNEVLRLVEKVISLTTPGKKIPS